MCLDYSSPPLIPLDKVTQTRLFHSDSLEHKKKISSNFEELVRPSSLRRSANSKSASKQEDREQNCRLDISSTKQQKFSRTPERFQPITDSLFHDNDYQNIDNNMTKESLQPMNSQRIINSNRYKSSHGISRMDRHRRKALKLSIALIMEFFICWTPLFLYHTIGTFDKSFYRSTPTIYLDLILLFSFASASCNPLTYYFMSKRYRSALYAYLSCCFYNKNQANVS